MGCVDVITSVMSIELAMRLDGKMGRWTTGELIETKRSTRTSGDRARTERDEEPKGTKNGEKWER